MDNRGVNWQPEAIARVCRAMCSAASVYADEKVWVGQGGVAIVVQDDTTTGNQSIKSVLCGRKSSLEP